MNPGGAGSRSNEPSCQACASSASITLASVNIPHLLRQVKAPVERSQNLLPTELSIVAGYVRDGGGDYDEGSAILVFDPKAKTLSGAQGLP